MIKALKQQLHLIPVTAKQHDKDFKQGGLVLQ